MSDTTDSRPLTIGMVAGEASGDNLGAPLVRELLALRPGSRLVGVGGPAMIGEGFESIAPMDRLSVNGFIDPLLRLPELIRLLYKLRARMLHEKVDCFVGIDFNFFNLLLEGMLRAQGITTVHYVSPTVWAWRRGRMRKIARNVDLMLALYPFETRIYEDSGVGVRFVGHPRALELREDSIDPIAVRDSLGLSARSKVVAILPGSRRREVQYTGRDFLRAAEHLTESVDAFVIPAANAARHAQIRELLASCPGAVANRVVLTMGGSLAAMAAADVVMANSGTATLEAMLLRKPMIMSYRVGPVTHALVSRMVRTRWFALPNILAERTLVREFLQTEAQPERMAAEVKRLLTADLADLLIAYDELHSRLISGERPGASAAEAVVGVCD